MIRNRLSLALASLGLALGACVIPESALGAETAGKLREPLPLSVAVEVRGHNGRSPILLSPDGQWVAHTVEGADNVARGSLQYSAEGFPFGEGDSRMEATLTNTKTGEDIRLGDGASPSWGVTWSPDGSRAAFYSTQGGEAGVWVWDKATRKAERFPGVIARPFFGFETIRWSSDGKKLLCKILPSGMTIAQANALGYQSEPKSTFPKAEPGKASVAVRRSDPGEAKPANPKPEATTRSKPEGDLAGYVADLAVLDLPTRKFVRIAERSAVRSYAFSPDDKRVAYTVLKGWEANSQQSNFDLLVVDAAGGAPRKLATDIRLGYGMEWSWSPDGGRLAYTSCGQLAKGEIVVISVADGASRSLKAEGVPSFDPDGGQYAPVWDGRGESLFAVGDAKLWRVDAGTGKGSAVGTIPGWDVRAIVMPFARPTILTVDAGRTAWVLAKEHGVDKAGFFAIDLSTSKVRPGLQEAKSYFALYNIDLNEKTGEIAFVSTDQHHMDDVWVFDTRGGSTRQVTRLNDPLDRYELGNSRLIEWRSMEGKPLKGALLLPPGYHAGQRVPLVVFVYGGENGSRYLNRFGFWNLPNFNCHILATRGYAVLAPDAPIRDGMPMVDLMGTVMPGVNAAIDQGYADPDRLVVMGQSYGSYCTLALITQTTRFKAAIITAADLNPDLFADYLGQGASGYYEHGQGNMHATIWENRDRYFENSPLFHFDRIQTPLLIGQGEKDGRLIASDSIYTALERLGKSVEYRIYEGEGHVLTQKPNVLDFWNRRLEFLAQNLDLQVDGKGGIVFEGGSAKSRNGSGSSAAPPPSTGASGR